MAINPLTGLEEDEMMPMGQAPAGTPPMPTSQDIVKDYISKKYNLGDFTPENRKKLEEASGLSFGDKAGAALAAIGAGFMGKDAASAGQNKLAAAKADKRQKLEDFDKGRSNKIQEFGLEREGVKADREDEAYKQSQELLAREKDPNSQESKLAQDLAKRMGYQGDPNSVTAERFKQFSPSLQKIYDIEQKKLDRQESRAARTFEQGVKSQEKKDAAAKLSDKQTGEIATHDKAIQAIDDIIAQKKNWDTGKLSMGMNKVAGMVGLDDSQKSAFKASVGEQLAQYIKGISGATVSPSERASLLENVPSVYDNDETFMAKAEALKKRMENNRRIELESMEKQGKNVAPFKSQSSSAPAMVRVSNGQETLEIPESDLADAEKDGYKRL